MSRARAVPLGRLQTQAELDRLKALLAAFPTTEAEDALLLSAWRPPSRNHCLAHSLHMRSFPSLHPPQPEISLDSSSGMRPHALEVL